MSGSIPIDGIVLGLDAALGAVAGLLRHRANDPNGVFLGDILRTFR